MIELPGYQIAEKIYESRNTLVHRGQREQDKKLVVLKTLSSERPSISSISRLNHEAEILKKQNFEDVLHFLEVVQYKSVPVLIIEDFGGIALNILYPSKPMELDAFLDIAIQLSEGLGKIHKENVIHKDINPSNLILNPETNQVQIIDFGISSLLSRENLSFRSPEHNEGTLAYISPEQTGRMNRAIDYRSDFYSLGITFYELLTGQRPFVSQDPMELVHLHIAGNPLPLNQLNSEIPESVEEIVMKLLSKTPEKRYQSAYGLIKDLKRCLEGWKEKGKIGGRPLHRFQLGEEDFSKQFLIPQKLYGREREIAILLDTFSQVSQGVTEMMLIAGYSGVGKSVLVNEVQKPIVQSRGYFVTGKFDQFKREIPFSAFIQVFQELIQQLLTESDENLERWQKQILEAVAPNAQLVIEVIPELELIIGKQPEVPSLPPTETQNRFNMYFRKFVNVFLSKDHPLVIFLDDLQWADNASLDLIKLMITDPESQYLLLLGAYRNNEVTPAHPLMLTLDAIQKQRDMQSLPAIETITLKTLLLTHVNELISETLHCGNTKARPLAKLVIEKTGGNPFFTKEFLISLYRENLLKLDLTQGIWQWDLKQIQSMSFTDNVVDLMIHKIQLLSDESQQVLKLAACIGNQFDLETLSVTYKQPQYKTSKALWETLEAGLILPLGENYRYIVEDADGCPTEGRPEEQVSEARPPQFSRRPPPPKVEYKFLHDRVQQGAYHLLSEEERKETHLQIGQLMLNRVEKNLSEESEQGENLIQIVNHMNLGLSLLREPKEKLNLAQMNLKAGLKAKGSTAYLSALEYFNTGILLLENTYLPETFWENEYSLAYDLYKEQADCKYLLGDFERAEVLVEELLKNTISSQDRGELYYLESYYNANAGKFNESIQKAMEGLKLFQVDLQLNPSEEILKQETEKVENNMKGKQISDLADTPPLEDPEKIFCQRFLSLMYIPSYLIGNIELQIAVTLKMTNIAIQYGEISGGVTYSQYAIYLMALQQYEDAYEFAQISMKISPNTYQPNYFFATMIGGWRTHLRQCLTYLPDVYKAALASGDLIYSRFTCLWHIFHSYFIGTPLQDVDETILTYSKFIEESGDPMSEGLAKLFQLWIQALTINPDPFDNKTFNENEKTENTPLPLHNVYYINKAEISFLFEEFEAAFEAANQAEKSLGATVGYVMHVNRCMYLCLSAIALYSTFSKEEQEQVSITLKATQDQMKIWADNCPENFLHKYLLVSAEIARISEESAEGRPDKAMQLYEDAIEKAKENEYLQDTALANELAAKYFLSRKASSAAKVYMEEARYWYHRWGATLKVEQLEEKYQELLASGISPKAPTSQTSSTTISTSLELSNLDLNTVMKSSQALSSEIILEQLLKKMMKILIENAGAQKGYLILKEKDKLFIEAEGQIDQEEMVALQSIPVELEGTQETISLPTSILSYVVRKQEEVVLENAVQTEPYAKDPYVIQHQPQSVMCVPILYQDKLNGLIYLENNLTTGAFTEDRLEMLELLSGQVAISIENAQLYENLEQKVQERTTDLEAAHEQILILEKAATEQQMAGGFAHEMRNALIGAKLAVDQSLGYDTPEPHVSFSLANSRELKKMYEFLGGLLNQEDLQTALSSMKKIFANEEHTDKTFQLVHNSLARALSITGEILVYSKIGHEHIEKIPLNLNRLIKKIFEEKRGEFEKLKITTRLDLQGSETIAGQETHFYSLIDNLVSNAKDALLSKLESLKHLSQAPFIEVSTMNDSSTHTIRITDNGIGIAPEHLPKIYEAFFSTKPKSGTGLGMGITKKILSLYQGTIDVESELGKGTSFTIKFPINKEDP